MKISTEIFLVIMLVIFIICGLMIRIYTQRHEVLDREKRIEELKKQVDFYKERVGGLKYITEGEEE